MQVYWNDDECSGDGKWWLGTIVQVKQPLSRGGDSPHALRITLQSLHLLIATPGRCPAVFLLQDVRDGENADVLADPFGAGQLWERFTLQFLGELPSAV